MNWKRIIAKEWLIIITLTISLPLAGYGLFLYQNRLYEKEQATIKAFNPSMAEIDAYLKSKEQRRLSERKAIVKQGSQNGVAIDTTDPYAHLSDDELDQLEKELTQKKQQLLSEMSMEELQSLRAQRIQAAKDEMLAKLIPHQRSSPSVEDNFAISLFLIPFLYLCLAIIRITYWSLTTVRRRQFPIQVSESNQLAPIHDY